MQSSISSYSPENTDSSSDYSCHEMSYEDYIAEMEDSDPYAPGFTPEAPVIPSNPSSFLDYMDRVHASYGYYPLEMIPGSDPIEFIVYFPCPYDPSPPVYMDEWSMKYVTDRFLHQFMWFREEWHLVWASYTVPVYQSME